MNALVLACITGALGIIIGWLFTELRWRLRLPALRRETLKKSRSVLHGQVSEHLAPLLPDFPFASSDVRFLGKPVDYIAFPGLTQGEPQEIVFLEIKTGSSKLSKRESQLKDIITKKRVRWEEYRR